MAKSQIEAKRKTHKSWTDVKRLQQRASKAEELAADLAGDSKRIAEQVIRKMIEVFGEPVEDEPDTYVVKGYGTSYRSQECDAE
jgi:hypothetical protein